MALNMKRILMVIGIFLIVLIGVLFTFHQEISRRALEYSLNRSTKSIFNGSLKIGKVSFDSRLRIYIEKIEANLKTEKGKIPVVIRSISSKEPITNFLIKGSLLFDFTGAGFANSKFEGIYGTFRFGGIWKRVFDLNAVVGGLDLGEIAWTNPENLNGSSGKITGEVSIKIEGGRETQFNSKLEIKEPGGVIGSRFLGFLAPYLPQSVNRENLRQLALRGGLVKYRGARLGADLMGSDKVKLFLFIAIPDYNLHLNTNIEVRVDQKNAFSEISQILGIIKKAGPS